ncbi:homogentisate 1,2-dioxygenase [Pollutimonas thiosulfatoxidans]|uniref:homogentisate 1,2-dioxygenase n=1 Tax=Pollutimonas thiosulfatoxidans TaxID=2028345 RepID=UPI001D18F953|nr:homogentisate 1,2-dioxygenase [Pollutimonas thiosulfatoxidans]
MQHKEEALTYLSGFGNELESEMIPGALPVGRNSPQQAPFGLYVEQLSGSPFVTPRHLSRRSWLYKQMPTASHGAFVMIDAEDFLSESATVAEGNRIRLQRQPDELVPAAFPFGVVTLTITGSCAGRSGGAVHAYAISEDADAPAFSNADAEMLWIPTTSKLRCHTEFGVLEIVPGEIALIPRGVKLLAQPEKGGEARGYLIENYGQPFQLPDLGPIGANGLAAARDFLHPVAQVHDRRGPMRWVNKFAGSFWATDLAFTPLDVVAWRGNYLPCKYDLSRFMVVNTVSFDHADPSIFTVLTSAGGPAGAPNLEIAIFPPRWQVAEDTFRPPWFHRNTMSEAMGLVVGKYEVRSDGFQPGGLAIHNCMMGHGPDASSWVAASTRKLEPEYLLGTMAFVLESALPFVATTKALESTARQNDYHSAWQGFQRVTLPEKA